MNQEPRNTTPYPKSPREMAIDLAVGDMKEARTEFNAGLIEQPDYEQRRRNFLLVVEGRNYAGA